MPLHQHFQINVHFAIHNGTCVSCPVSVDGIVRRGLFEEVSTELRHEEAVMRRSEE